MLDVEIGNEVVLLANVGGEIHAIGAWCPHQGTALALGTLRENALSCWAHLWRFDVRTGDAIWPPMARVVPGYRLRVYPVRVEGDNVLVSTLRSLKKRPDS
ncbi:MAG: bphF [Chloroflexi bacterium]|nr:bphF [Chloroflexota bacterium]